MKKVVLLAVIIGWMGLGCCCQSQCTGNRCSIIKQARTQKVESKSLPQSNTQTTAANYLSIQPEGQKRFQ